MPRAVFREKGSMSLAGSTDSMLSISLRIAAASDGGKRRDFGRVSRFPRISPAMHFVPQAAASIRLTFSPSRKLGVRARLNQSFRAQLN